MKIEKKSQVCIKALGKAKCEVVEPPNARGVLIVAIGNVRMRVHLDEVVELFEKKTTRAIDAGEFLSFEKRSCRNRCSRANLRGSMAQNTASL